MLLITMSIRLFPQKEDSGVSSLLCKIKEILVMAKENNTGKEDRITNNDVLLSYMP